MEKYVPDIYQKSIYNIDYEKLRKRGIKCLIFDLDNTLVPINEKIANDKLIALFDKLKEMKFKLIIMTNNTKNRIKPFKEALDVDGYSSARKPKPKTFIEIMNSLKYKESEIALIGDQIITDIKGGNDIGITTILVNPISSKDLPWTKINRLLERRIMQKLRKKELFTKGRYYE